MSQTLARQRCWTHAQREAVSRCPSCKRYFCRECVTEHDGRLLCVQCLSAGTAVKAAPATRWLLWTAAAVAGILLAFLVFYTTGYVLRQLPPAWSGGREAE